MVTSCPRGRPRTVFLGICLLVATVGTMLLYNLLSQPPDGVVTHDGGPWQCRNETPSQVTTNLSDVTVLCLVFTTPDQWQGKAKAVRDTWSRRCDKAVFIYSRVSGEELPSPALAIDVPDGRHHLTTKTMLALDLAYRRYGAQFDWFMKADDDVYVIMDNLRYLLSFYNASEPHYAGRLFPRDLDTGYNSGGAGYLLSRPALEIIHRDRTGARGRCRKYGAVEDLDVGRCLAQYGVLAEKTTDAQCRLKFHSDDPLNMLNGDLNQLKYYHYSKHKQFVIGNPNGEKMLSPYTVSFHRVSPDHMYFYDFLLQDLKRPGASS